MKKSILLFSSIFAVLLGSCGSNDTQKPNDETSYAINITEEKYYDKVLGGLTAELWGNFTGLPTEFEFTDSINPSPVPWVASQTYSTDDDTSLEYVFTHAMETYGVNDITYKDMVVEWKDHIRDYIWVGNETAKNLMDKGHIPPYTGSSKYNKDYRAIDAQIECEVFGLISPGMKQNAKERSYWWMRSVGDKEALSCASFYSSLIAELFVNDDIIDAIHKTMELFDEKESSYKITKQIFTLKEKNPDYTWVEARNILRNLYYKNNNTLDCEINFAMTLLSLIYGNGDFDLTGQIALRAGFDNDCNAATACLMIGVMKGYSNLPSDLKAKSGDLYINTNRPGLPNDTISNWAKRVTELGKTIIKEANGKIENAELKMNDLGFTPNSKWVEEEIRIGASDKNWTNKGFSKIYNKEFYDKFGLASESKEASLEFKFNGNFVTLYALTAIESGKVEIFVDDISYGIVDLNVNATLTLGKEINHIAQSLVKRIYNLENKEHTLKIIPQGNGTVVIDSIGYGVTVDADNGGN